MKRKILSSVVSPSGLASVPNRPTSFRAPSSLGTREGVLTAWPPRQIAGDPVTERPQLYPAPPHLFPFSEGFLEKEARSLLGA